MIIEILNNAEVRLGWYERIYNPKIVRKIEIGQDTFEFTMPLDDLNDTGIALEGYVKTCLERPSYVYGIYTDNKYVVKEIKQNQDSGTASVFCSVGIDELEGRTFLSFNVTGTISNVMYNALQGTGWICDCYDVTDSNKSRTVTGTDASSLALIKQALSTYNLEAFADAINKTVYVKNRLGQDRGTFLIEDYNLRKLDISSDSHGLYTEIEAYGKDGITIGGSTDSEGRTYLSDYTYSEKSKRYIWRDDRYTISSHLQADAAEKLSKLATPTVSYSVDIVDLDKAEIRSTHENERLDIGDTVTLSAHSLDGLVKQRIVELTLYPDDPARNACVLSNAITTTENILKESMDAAASVQSIVGVSEKIDRSEAILHELDVLVGSAEEIIEAAERAEAAAESAETSAESAEKNAATFTSKSFDVLNTTFSSGYINKTGSGSSSSSWEQSAYVPVGGRYLIVTCPMSQNQTQLDNVAAVAFYKTQTASTFISYVPIIDGTFGKTKCTVVEIPQTAGFAKFSRAAETDHMAIAVYNLSDQLATGIADNVLPVAGFRSGEYTTNGITFKTNDDLSVTLNGTATNTAIYNIVVSTDNFTLSPGLYCLSGADSGSASMYIHLTVGSEQYVQFGTERVIRVNATSQYLLAIRVLSGVTANNVTFYPMLERGCVRHGYFPKKYDNKSLYDSLTSISTKNLLQFPYNSKYPKYLRRGITFEVNSDGSVTINGTATGDAYYMFVSQSQKLSLPAGQYTLSGCTGGGLNTYSLRLYGTGGNGMVCTTAPVTHEYNNDLTNYRLFIYVKSGTTIDNITISPMLEEGAIAHAYRNPDGIMNIVSVGGEVSSKIKNAMRIFHQPWTAMRDLDYYTRRGETTENSEYIGVPYASVFSIGGDVLYQRNLATFYSAVRNPASIMYQPLKLVNGASVQSNYGAVCTSFTGWINGMPLQVNADELPRFGFERYDYNGADNVAIGDCLLTVEDQHCMQIYDISVDSTTYSPVYIHVTDQSGSGARVLKYTISQFEDLLIENGGKYELGRYPNQNVINVKSLKYATDVIPDMGDKTYYYTGNTVEVYVDDPNVTEIHIKKDNGEYSTLTLSELSSRTVNDVTVYDISSYTSVVGTYEITTDKDKYTKCQIKRIDTGSISISGTTVTLSNYSSNLNPVWAQVFSLKEGDPGIYPSPTGYVAHGFAKVLIDSDTFTVTLPDSSDYDGYYIRINYETGFGQAFGSSEYIMY